LRKEGDETMILPEIDKHDLSKEELQKQEIERKAFLEEMSLLEKEQQTCTHPAFTDEDACLDCGYYTK
jgi:hypothetical protein